MKKTFILITLLFATMLASPGFARSEHNDSLKNELDTTTNSVERFNLPTGQGTELGLSLSYDIVKAHGGPR